jgi:hypothetical protein
VEQLENSFTASSSNFCENLDSICRWIEELQIINPENPEHVTLNWIQAMLQHDPKQRPTAHRLVELTISVEQKHLLCCVECDGENKPRGSNVSFICASVTYNRIILPNSGSYDSVTRSMPQTCPTPATSPMITSIRMDWPPSNCGRMGSRILMILVRYTGRLGRGLKL